MEVRDLLSAIRDSTRETVGSRKAVAVAYSGGLDSSIVARIAGEFSNVKCYTAAFPGSYDHASVGSLAREESVNIELLTLDAEGLVPLMTEASRVLGSRDPIRISYTVPMLRAVEGCLEDLLLVGSGADELFGGYAKYSSMADPAGAMSSDFEKALAELNGLEIAAAHRGKHIGAPLASPQVRAVAGDIPTLDKVRGMERKIALRAVAKELGLPSHSRPKKAAQYSSGALKEMKRLAGSRHMSLSDWTAAILNHELTPRQSVQSP